MLPAVLVGRGSAFLHRLGTLPHPYVAEDLSVMLVLGLSFFLAVLGLRFCARAFSSCGASGGHFSSRCASLSLSRPLLLRSTASRRAGSVIVAHGPSCSAACGIFLDQGPNPCPLHRQADSQPLRHQGSPRPFLSLPGGLLLPRTELFCIM